MLTNYNQVVQLISLMNTPNVSQAQAELVHLGKIDKQVLPCLHNLLKDSTQQGWVHTIAATFINKLVCDEQTSLDVEHASRVIVEILMDLQIDPIYKRTIQRSIVYIISSLEEPFLTAFRQKVFPLMQSQRLRDTLYLFIGCWTIPKIDVNHIIYLYNVALRKTLDRFIDFDPNQIMMAAEYNQIIKTWSIFWEALLRSDEENAQKVMYEMMEDERFPQIIFFIYEWVASPPLFICTTQGLAEINLLKKFTAQLHLMMLEKSIQIRKKSSNTPVIFAYSQKMMMRIMQNLQLVSSQKEQFDKYECKDLVINFIKILTVFLCASPQSFTNLWKEILTKIVIPYIQIESDEINCFEEYPDQFIALQEDCAEKQTFGILKTEACKLLERMTDKSQKIVQDSFILNYVMKLSFNSILALAGAPITHNLDCGLIPLETAITIISVFSYSVKSYQQEVKDLAQYLTPNFLTSQSPIDRTKLYILMGYIFDDVYENNLQKGAFWVEASLKDNGHPTLIKACLDFMSNVADQYYQNFFLQALIDRIYENTEGSLWDALTKMINTQYNKIDEMHMQKLVQCIFQRLQTEIQVLKNDPNKLTVIIINLIQLLCAIIQLPGYCQDKPNLKISIWKVTNILDLAIRYSFDDEILQIILAFVRGENEIIKLFLDILPQILEIFKKQVYASKNCLLLLNQFIVKDKSRESLPAILKILNTAMLTYLMQLSQKAKKRQIKPILIGNIMVLLQNFLFVHRDILGDNELYEISSLALRFVPQKKQQITDKILLARALNIILICHMLRPTDFVWQKINSFYEQEIYFSYDISVFQAIVQIQVFKQPEYSMKGNMINILAKVISMFKKRKQKQKNSKKIRQKYGKQKSRIKLNRYSEYETEVRKMTTPFDTNNSQKRFINLIKKLRNQYYTLFPQIFSQVSQQDQKIIMELQNVTQLVTGKQRIIYQVKGTKQNVQVLEEEITQKRGGMKENDSEEEQETMKRQRKILKQDKKKKKQKEQKMME